MSYEPPKIARITLIGKKEIITNATLETSTMQLPGFMSIKGEVSGKSATRFIALNAIEEILIDNDELLKTMPISFVPEIRLRTLGG